MEISQSFAVIILGADEINASVVIQFQVIDDIIRPVCKSESCIEDILAPAPLIKAGAHRDRRACFISIEGMAHIVVLECLKCVMTLFSMPTESTSVT